MTTRRSAHKVRAGHGPALAVALLLAASPSAAQAPPPDADWRSVETPHFRVTYPAGMEELGLEVAARAERARGRLAEAFLEPPPGRTEILLADHVDLSNGSARVAPRKEILLFARPPVDAGGLSHFDDWLELVLVHEMVHVFHLDRTGPLGRFLRAIFGRVPSPWPFFPELGTPRWTVEGLATYYESALTRSGRLRGTYHDMVLRTLALEGAFEGVDQASGESPVWPGGQRPYVYGGHFVGHLADRHGQDRLDDFVDAVAGQWIPYRLNAAARDGFGQSFSEAWEEWREEVAAGARELAAARAAARPATPTEAVTREARYAVFPRVSPDGSTLVYARADGRSDVQLRRVSVGAGADDGEELTRTNGAAAFDFTPDGDVVFAQLERRGPYRLHGDLYRARPDGAVGRLTRGARVDHPSVVPGGGEAVAVRTGGGTTWLVAVDLESGELRDLTSPDPDVHWAFPAVSPDGRWIAAARWTGGAFFDVVLLEPGTGRVVEVTRDRALDIAPAWSPDGRWLVWSSDRSGVPDVLAAEIDPGSGRSGPVRQVTNLPTGTAFPSVSPDGRWLHLSVHHATGWEVERLPFDPASFFDPFPLHPRFEPDDPGGDVALVEPLPGLEPGDYEPLRTLLPRYWEPVFAASVRSGGFQVIEPSYGFRTTAEDLVGRHSAALELLVSTTDGLVSGGIGYAYRGLGNPILSLQLSQGWDAAGPFAFVDEGDTIPFFLRERERSAFVASTFRRSRFRNLLALTTAGGMVWEERSVLDPDFEPSERLTLSRPRARLADARVTVEWSDARSHAFSVGDEEGLSLAATGRVRRELDVPGEFRDAPGVDRSLEEIVGLLRAYEGLPGPGFADHVVALRAAGGVAGGPGADRFHYEVGGVSGEVEPVTGLGLFGGRSYLFPVRGFPNGLRQGSRAWSGALEYRFPLALVNDAPGLFPVHLDRLSGSLFVDAGNAWGPARADRPNPRPDPLASAGAELVADLLTFFSIPVTLRTGVAVRFSGGDGAAAYVRFGRSF